MKKINFKILIILFVIVPSFLLASEQVEIPPVEEFQLTNNIQGCYIKDELPQFTLAISIRMGYLNEKKNDAGITDLLIRSIKLGGSSKHKGMTFQEAVDKLGGRLSIFSSWERTTISVQVLEKYSDKAFALVSEILKNPNIESKYVENARLLALENLHQKNDDPASIAFEKVKENIFDGVGYGAVSTENKIKSYSVKNLQDRWFKYVNSSNMIFGVVSSLPFSDVKKLSQKYLQDVKSGAKQSYSVDKNINNLIKEKSKNIYFVQKDIPQATIVLGTVAPDFNTNSLFDLTIMNYILGGGSFNSRLMMEIRVKRGLAYSVQSIYRSRLNTGLFMAFTQTKTKNVSIALSLLIENLNKISKENVSANELKWAKNSISNSYIFNFETNIDLLSNYFMKEYYGLPETYFSEYTNKILSVNSSNIKKYTKAMLANGLIKVVVGNKSLKKELEKFGTVIEIKE